jgi:hypothetical protein
MPLISVPEITVYKRIQVKVVPRPDVAGAKPWMTNHDLMLLKAAHDRRRFLRLAPALVLGIVGLFGLTEVARDVLAGAPSKTALAAQADRVARQALAEFSSPLMALAISSTSATLKLKSNRSQQQYQVTVWLRLLQPLYVPAHSNGTLEYEQLRLGLETAKAQTSPEDWRDKLNFPADLPQLVQRSHFAGEKLRITATLEATRSGWHWRFPSSIRYPLVCQSPFKGGILSTYPNVAIYDELRPNPALRAHVDEVRLFLRRRAGAERAVPKTSRDLP